MFSSMTNWFGTTTEKEEIVNEEGNKNKEESGVDDKKQEKENLSPESTGNEQSTEESDGDIDLTFDSAKHKLEDVSSKALNAAKEWGSM